MPDSTNRVRLGIVGMGNMGATHARSLLEGTIAGCRLTAVADETRRAPEF